MKNFAIGAMVLVCGAGSALAAVVPYPNAGGATVDFTGIVESTTRNGSAGPSDPGALFGAPTVVGDSLRFNPLNFQSSSANGAFDITDGQLVFTVASRPGNFISDLNFSERGDYTLAGLGNAATNATVSAAIFIRIEEINGVSVNAINLNGNMVFTPSGGSFELPGEAGTAVIWQGAAAFDIDAYLAGLGISGRATKATVTLDNTLVTFSQSGTISFIKKKQAEGVTVTVLPTPGTAVLLGLSGLIAARRKR